MLNFSVLLMYGKKEHSLRTKFTPSAKLQRSTKMSSKADDATSRDRCQTSAARRRNNRLQYSPRFARRTSIADVRLVDVDRLWANRNCQRSSAAACVPLEAEKSLRGRRAAEAHRFLPDASDADRHIKYKSCSEQARESTGERRAALFERQEVLMLKTSKLAISLFLLVFGERKSQ